MFVYSGILNDMSEPAPIPENAVNPERDLEAKHDSAIVKLLNKSGEKFVGYVVDGKFYLIFEMMSEAGETSGQKKFLFAGDSLILES